MIRTNLKLIGLMFLIWILRPVLLFAGGWTSSGGDIYKDAFNPWFIQGKESVHYCIDIDSESISASRGKIQRLVQRAISNWKRLLIEATMISNSKVRVGFQEFVQIPCERTGKKNPIGTEDLRFQFGYGTLSESQFLFLGRNQAFTRIIGNAVRTDYEEETLQGKGFIYFASDRGPYRYDGGPDLLNEAWQYDALLYAVIMHELGHVFGLPHFGDLDLEIMSTKFIELIFQRYWIDIFKIDLTQAKDLENYFLISEKYETCSLTDYARAYFGLSSEENCVSIKMIGQTKAEISAYISKNVLEIPFRKLGQF